MHETLCKADEIGVKFTASLPVRCVRLASGGREGRGRERSLK